MRHRNANNKVSGWSITHWVGLVTVVFFLFLVATVSSTEAADPSWTAKYWNNRNLSGTPIIERQESELNFDWGDGGPDYLLADDSFSARWTRRISFSGGTYRFTATMDDGMRVWIDGSLVIDSWWDSQVHSMSADVYLSGGEHDVKVDYYEVGGKAVAKLQWSAVSGGQGNYLNWRGSYFNNTSLSGTPAYERDDQRIEFDWGVGSPVPGVVGADNFSVRWTRNINAENGRYLFQIAADDGVRLWVNNQLIVDQWHDAQGMPYTAEIDLPSGSIPIKIEYYEGVGGAKVSLGYYRKGSASGTFQYWRGEYFNNRYLSGSPSATRDDSQINFNWGNGSPAPGINVDNFSVRWTRSLTFNAGRYKFTATSDDGIRIWANNQLIIDAWTDHPAQTFSAEIDLPGGNIPLRVEYYDSTGQAQAQASWQQVAPVVPPAPSTNGTATVIIANHLNVRTGPGVTYPVITVIDRGTVVTLLGRNNAATWAMVRLPNGTQGWVSAYFLASTTPISSLPVTEGNIVTPPSTGGTLSGTVTAYHLNVRSGPGVSYPTITVINKGLIVTATHRNATSTWVKITLPNGTQGWSNAHYIQLSGTINALPIG